MTLEQSEAIQKALDIARAAQAAYEEALFNLEAAMPTRVDLRGVDLQGHDVKSIVKLTNKMAKDELDEIIGL